MGEERGVFWVRGSGDQQVREVIRLLVALGVEIETLAGHFAEATGLHPTDVRALRVLHVAEGPLTAGELGEKLDLTTGATTRTIDRLERSGHVERVRDPTGDRRRVYLRPTEEARAVAEEFFGGLEATAAGAMRDLSVDDLHVVARFLALASKAIRARRDEIG